MTQLQVSQFSQAEIADLKEHVDEASIVTKEAEYGTRSYGVLDPEIITLIISSKALFAFCLWLIKNKKNERIRFTEKIKRPDGSEEERHLEMDLKEESTSSEIVQSLTDFFKLPGNLTDQD